jgi:hypothetical protein
MPGQKNTSIRTFRPSDLDGIKALIHRTIDLCYAGVYPKEAVQGGLVEQTCWVAGEICMEQYNVDFESMPWQTQAQSKSSHRHSANGPGGRRVSLFWQVGLTVGKLRIRGYVEDSVGRK